MEIKRDFFLNQIVKKKDNGRVKIITGVRRCGKSYLLFELYKNYLVKNGVPEDQIITLALDETDNARYRNPVELNEFVKAETPDSGKKYYVFIDEIQECSEVVNPWLPDSKEKITFVDTVLGLVKRKNLDLYITGSNSRMLSSDVVTQFRDRGDEIHVTPLLFSEFLAAYGSDRAAAWRDYYTFGGMPYLFSLETAEEKSLYLKNLFQETYIRDIVERRQIRNDREILETLLDFVSSAAGSLTNPSKLAKRFDSEKKIKITNETVSVYLGYFEEAYLLQSAKRYDIKGSAYFSTPLKYYFTDAGLRNARINFRQIKETHLMENIIFNELTARGYNVDVGFVAYWKYVQDKEGKKKRERVQQEVDFVVNQGNRRVYIQSALNVDDPEKKAQETDSLNRISDSFRKIVVVGKDIVPWYDEKGILYVGLFDFLLNGTGLN